MTSYLKTEMATMKNPYYEIKPCNICFKYCDDNVLVNRRQYCRKCLDKTWRILDQKLETKFKDDIVDNLMTKHHTILKLINMLK